MKVPAVTNSSQSRSFSGCEPSTQWMWSGWQSPAMVLTHCSRWLFFDRGAADEFFLIIKKYAALECRSKLLSATNMIDNIFISFYFQAASELYSVARKNETVMFLRHRRNRFFSGISRLRDRQP